MKDWRTRCEPCRIEARKHNYERFLERRRAWRKANPDKVAIEQEKKRVWYAENRQHNAEYRLRYQYKKYGITFEQAEEMARRQNNQCAICRRVFSENTSRYHIDHDHETGRVRGLLCRECNLGIGHFKTKRALFDAWRYIINEGSYEQWVALREGTG